MAIIKLDIIERGLFDDGREFGAAGAYERIEAVARYRLDPKAPANRTLCDIDCVTTDEDGYIHFDGDVSILRPVDPQQANRSLLVEVPNRGKRTAQRQFNYAPIQVAHSRAIDPGDGFLMRHGWTVAFCGWQWDVPHGPQAMSVRAPLVETERCPAVSGREQMQLRVQPHVDRAFMPLTDQHVGPSGNHLPIAAKAVDDPSAELMVRDHYYAPATPIARNQWRFARVEGDAVVPCAEHVWLAGGFSAGKVYDLVYTPAECRWGGAGLVAMRDLGDFLRRDERSPVFGLVDHSIAEGISQCGRFLRHFLFAGMNQSEAGARVYDGMLIHIAGGRRGEFNHRFAQPSVQPTPSLGDLFQFADNPQVDTHSGASAGLLDRCVQSDTAPKIFYTDTAAEYWRGDASLSHTTNDGRSDAEPPDNVRRYLFRGAQHSPGLLPLTDKSTYGTRGGNLHSFVDYRPLYRACLENLRRWLGDSSEPPASAYPRLSDGTAVSRDEALETLVTITPMVTPDAEVLPTIHPLYLGPQASKGIGEYPADFDARVYATFVSAVDADGNEVAGVPMPDVAVPIATHSGFAPRHGDNGGTGQLLEYLGSSVPFALDASAREATGDPRASISERYADRDAYLCEVREAAKHLVENRTLLPEDVEHCVGLAADRYDAVVAAQAL
ncbi:MAG: hypothetical protein HOI95_16065 [Chromatiales bacterium]|nr:hypothetical protein [Chromatiales bacterium]